MGIELVTDATSEPITLADLSGEIFDFPKGNANSADANLRAETQIIAATRWLQGKTQQQFIQATWKQTWDKWPGDGIFKIDLRPLSSVTTLKYYDVDGTLTTVSSSDYWVITSKRPPIVQLKPSFSYPSLEDGRPAVIELTFVAGYSSVANVPALAKQGIKLLATHWFKLPDAAPMQDSTEAAAFTPAYKDVPFGVFSIADMLSEGGYT